MTPVIRPMTETDDVELITDWFGGIADEWLLEFNAPPPPREVNRDNLLRWMRGEDGRSRVLIAEAPATGGQPAELLGFAICLLHEETGSGRRFGSIHGIYVDQQRRGEGVGRVLKEAADTWCRDAGAAYMKAHIGIGNKAMLRVCKLLGYEPWMVTWVRKFD